MRIHTAGQEPTIGDSVIYCGTPWTIEGVNVDGTVALMQHRRSSDGDGIACCPSVPLSDIE